VVSFTPPVIYPPVIIEQQGRSAPKAVWTLWGKKTRQAL